MRNKDELLKKLVPGTVNLKPRIGGKIEISWEDIAGCLSKIDSHISDYARLKYGINKTGQNLSSTFLALKLELENKPVAEEWPNGKMNKLIKMVLLQEISPNICTTCQGTKSRKINSKIVECFSCSGTGRVKLTQSASAEFIGVDLRTYTRTWKNRANHIYAILSEWDYQLNRAIGKNIK